MTQIVFDLSYLESFLERIGGSPVPLLVGVWPIRSLELAVRVHNETPGIVVPEHVQERYRAAGADAAGGRRRARPRAGGAGARARRGRLRRRAVPPAARRARPARDALAAAGRDRAASPARARSAPARPGRRSRPRADPRGEDGRLDLAGLVDGRPARVAVANEPADRGHLAQRAAQQHVGGRADPPGRASNGPSSG